TENLMTSIFLSKKAKILEQLSTPTQDYTDASPKGSVDAPVQTLVKQINDIDSLVTTSSCSGRIAIYIEGAKIVSTEPENVGGASSVAKSSQGKGGGSWLFVSHTPLDDRFGEDASNSLFSQLLSSAQNESHVSVSPQMQTSTDLHSATPPGARLLHFKFEPLILHILCSSLWAARKVLIASQAAGFRESGISSVPEPSIPIDTQDGHVMVAVRTTGLTMDAPIGYLGEDDNIKLNVSDAYLGSLIKMGNQRFATNEQRKQRLRDGIM
ncbi:tRNA wybutosine-synthesizing protein, partial [Elsinoe ampelina]